MKKIATLMETKMTILFLISLVSTACLIEEVEQPTQVNAGETFTTIVTVTAVGAESNIPHHGAMAVMIPDDWSYTSGSYTTTDDVGSGTMLVDSDNGSVWLTQDGVGAVDINTFFTAPNNMQWVYLLSDVGSLTDAGVMHEVTLNFGVGSTNGTYPIGYVATVNTGNMMDYINADDADNEYVGVDTSFNHMVEVVGGTTTIEPILTMTPEDGDDITIGSSGGSFGFNALLVNSTNETKFYEAYLWAQLPNGNWYGPIAPTPVTVRVRPGRQVSVNLNQRVPGGAPDGWYHFIGEIYLDGGFVGDDGFWFWKGDPENRGTEPISGNQELVTRTHANVIPDADDSEWISFYDEYGVEAKRGDVWTDEGLYHEDGVAISVLQLSAVTIPNLYQLHQNYPNPFNPVTTLRYDLPEDALVNITIYDLMGHNVRSLVNSRQTAGYHSIQWDATNNLGEPISAGMYIYRIPAGDFVGVKKLILMK